MPKRFSLARRQHEGLVETSESLVARSQTLIADSRKLREDLKAHRRAIAEDVRSAGAARRRIRVARNPG